MKPKRFLLLIPLVFVLCAFGSAIAQRTFTPPTPDGNCLDAFDLSVIDEATWNQYSPVQCSPTTARLFSEAGPNDVFEFELQADFDVINDLSILRANQDEASSPGILRYVDAISGETIVIPITLEARGKSRYDCCTFRPLKIVFDDNQVGNIFEGASKKVKIVTHCNNSDSCDWFPDGTPEEFEQRLLAEYYFYQVLETLDSTALATRLARITYRDDDGTEIATKYAFLREREDDACVRCGCVDEADDSDELIPDPTSVLQGEMYNKFVYNEDYIIEDGHNTRKCKDEDLNGYYIPYDWDLTGVMCPEYWKNHDVLYTDNVYDYYNWLISRTDPVATKIQALHIVRHDQDMRAVLNETLMDDETHQLMQNWYDLYMCALKCYLGIEPTIDIIEPTQALPASLQPGDGTGRLLIRIDFQPAILIPATEEFEVQIGGVVAPIITGALVGGQYWLIVQTPASIDAEADLHVLYSMCGIESADTEENAVSFGDPSASDVVLVIDTSGSMDDDRKMESAINAAVLFTNTLRDNDRIGVIEYSGKLSGGYGRTEEVYSINTAAGHRQDVENQLRDLRPSASTPLGTGLLRGLDELNSVVPAERNDVRAIILLSDGKENVPNYWNDPPEGHYSPPEPPNTPVVNTFDAPEHSEVQIDTVSLGPDSDPVLMAAISDHRGTYRHSDIVSGTEFSAVDRAMFSSIAYAAGNTGIDTPSDLSLRLSNLYEHLHNDRSAQQRILQKKHVTSSGKALNFVRRNVASLKEDSADIIEFPMETGLNYATITVSWTKPGAKNLQIFLPPEQNPNNIAITNGITNTVFRIDRPAAGDWRIGIPAKTTGEEFFVTLSGTSKDIGLVRALTNAVSPNFPSPGDPINIVCSLFGDKPILGAIVTANAISIANEEASIHLHDDGKADDAVADDGFYSGAFTKTTQGGAFVIEVNAAWTGTDGTQHSRIFPLSVSIPELDTDGDGISDQDETRLGLDPEDAHDGGEDPDRDSLPNWKEHLIGLDLFNPDSDGGGTPDGVEVATGSDPENPDDDAEAGKDTDGDTMPDAWETAFGLNPEDPTDADEDRDGDNLSNRMEFENGSSPNNADTDNDLIPDGREVEEGTDPTDSLNRIMPGGNDDVDSDSIMYLIIVILFLLVILILLFIYLNN